MGEWAGLLDLIWHALISRVLLMFFLVFFQFKAFVLILIKLSLKKCTNFYYKTQCQLTLYRKYINMIFLFNVQMSCSSICFLFDSSRSSVSSRFNLIYAQLLFTVRGGGACGGGGGAFHEESVQGEGGGG